MGYSKEQLIGEIRILELDNLALKKKLDRIKNISSTTTIKQLDRLKKNNKNSKKDV